MKITISCLLFFVLIIICIKTGAATNTPKRYPKSKFGIIKYEIYGATIVGSEVVYYDDWGSREATYTKTTIDWGGVLVTKNALTIFEDNGRWINNIDLDARTGIRMKNPRYKEYIGKSRMELEKIDKNKNKDAGGERREIEMIAGKPCIVWEVRNTGVKTCTWNGIILKKTCGSGYLRTTRVATEITERIPIPEEKFTIPPDIEMKTVDMSTLHGN